MVDLGQVLHTVEECGCNIDLDCEANDHTTNHHTYAHGWAAVPTAHTVQSAPTTDATTQTHFPMGSTRAIEEVPVDAIYATVAMAWNGFGMFVAETVIEILVLVEVFPKIPFRLIFYFLTLVSGLLGAQTLLAVHRQVRVLCVSFFERTSTLVACKHVL